MDPIELLGLGTEMRNPGTMNLDEMTPAEIISTMNREDAGVVAAVAETLPQVARIVEFATQSLRQGGRIIYIGAGTSGRLGVLDAVECPPTFGVTDQEVMGLIAGGEGAFVKAKEGAEDDEEQGGRDLDAVGLTARDTVIGLTASGRTPYVLGALRRAREVGCPTAAISCNRGAQASRLADAAVEVDTGPEVLSGSTRLKAGTAEKMILNMISTASMVGVGKVYQNLMVDLSASNKKLRDRSVRIIMQAVGVGRQEAEEALQASGGDLKPALLMLLCGCSIDTAVSLLEREPNVRKAYWICSRAEELLRRDVGPYEDVSWSM